jgi:RNA polymerase sigma factor (sigma-70 family)
MSHEIDAADAKLLAAGEYAFLLAKYEPVIIGRCIARLHGHADADDVAQDVKLRLWAELRAGKEYPVPFSVVVHQVIGWTIADYFGGRPTDVPLPEDCDAGDPSDALGELLDRNVVASMLDGLEGRTRAVMELRYLERLDVDQISERLEMEPNAVHQALHRGQRKKVERRYHELETG